jgi:hemoglobin
MATTDVAASRPDLDSRGQIEEMVRQFYASVNTDDLLGPVFNDVAAVDWDLHLPKLTAFWCRALLGIEGFQGNPYARHAAVHAVSPLTLAHFERWLELFERTLDGGWAGVRAERARTLVHNVARVHASQLGVDEGSGGLPISQSKADPHRPS